MMSPGRFILILRFRKRFVRLFVCHQSDHLSGHNVFNKLPSNQFKNYYLRPSILSYSCSSFGIVDNIHGDDVGSDGMAMAGIDGKIKINFRPDSTDWYIQSMWCSNLFVYPNRQREKPNSQANEDEWMVWHKNENENEQRHAQRPIVSVCYCASTAATVEHFTPF